MARRRDRRSERTSAEPTRATKAIEQWRALLRQEPTNREARDALKRVHRQTGNAPALAELLEQIGVVRGVVAAHGPTGPMTA